jgi:hypothetical protein
MAERRIRPEGRSEVTGEVGMAVLRRRNDSPSGQSCFPEAPDIVNGEYVGVEVDDPGYAGREEIGQVVASVVQRRLESGADGGGDEIGDELLAEDVDLEPKGWKGGGDKAAEERGGGVGGDEVKEEGLGARGVLEQGEDSGHGTAQVMRVEGHGDVNTRGIAEAMAGAGAGFAVAEERSLGECGGGRSSGGGGGGGGE